MVYDIDRDASLAGGSAAGVAARSGHALSVIAVPLIIATAKCGSGVEYRPDVPQNFPQGVQSLLRQGLVAGGVAGFFLNLIFPEEG